MPTDKQRLDFIELRVLSISGSIKRGRTLWTCFTFHDGYETRNLRATIDAAMKAEKGRGK